MRAIKSSCGKTAFPQRASIFKVSLLQPESVLREIFLLRVKAWENSPNELIVNREIFPNGWQDDLDTRAQHLVITNDKDKIIASARLNHFTSKKDFPFDSSMGSFSLPDPLPFAYYSRLVIHPEYREICLSSILDSSIIKLCKKNGVKWCIAFSSNRTDFMVENLNFQVWGKINMLYHDNTPARKLNVIIKKFDNKG